MDVYRGQYGRGLGGVLAGIARTAVPFILPTLKAVGRSLLLKGAAALDDSTSEPPKARPLKRLKRPYGLNKKRKRDALS